MLKKIIIGIVSLGIVSSFIFAGDFEDGKKAYDSEDYKKAFPLLKKACDGGNAKGCKLLGLMYHNGLGVKQDYQKACDGREALGCNNLGYMYEKGQG